MIKSLLLGKVGLHGNAPAAGENKVQSIDLFLYMKKIRFCLKLATVIFETKK